MEEVMDAPWEYKAMINSQKAVYALLMGAIIISFSGVFVKLSDVTPTVSAFYRVFFGSVFLLGATFYKKEFRNQGWRRNLQAAFCGLLFAFDLLTWHISIQYIGPGLATILGNCQVFILAVIGILFLKEKPGLLFIISVPFAFFGLFLLIGVDTENISEDYAKGIWFGFATACFYAAFLLTLRNLQGKDNDPPLFYYQFIISITSAALLASKIFLTSDTFAIPNTSTLASLVGLGFFSQAIGWVLISSFLPKIRASHAGLILLLQPSLSLVWDVIIFDRETGLFGWLGLFFVLSAIYLNNLRSKN